MWYSDGLQASQDTNAGRRLRRHRRRRRRRAPLIGQAAYSLDRHNRFAQRRRLPHRRRARRGRRLPHQRRGDSTAQLSEPDWWDGVYEEPLYTVALPRHRLARRATPTATASSTASTTRTTTTSGTSRSSYRGTRQRRRPGRVTTGTDRPLGRPVQPVPAGDQLAHLPARPSRSAATSGAPFYDETPPARALAAVRDTRDPTRRDPEVWTRPWRRGAQTLPPAAPAPAPVVARREHRNASRGGETARSRPFCVVWTLSTTSPPRCASASCARRRRAATRAAAHPRRWSSARRGCSTRRRAPSSRAGWRSGRSASGRSSRCSPTRPSTRSWSAAPGRCGSSARGRVEETAVAFALGGRAAPRDRADPRAARAARRRGRAAVRRAPARRLARQRRHPAAGARRPGADDPALPPPRR